MDDLLIPVPAAAAPAQRRSVSRDPADVLSLFDQPKPEPPPKPVMLGGASAMGGSGRMMMSPPGSAGMSRGQDFNTGPMSPYGGGMGPPGGVYGRGPMSPMGSMGPPGHSAMGGGNINQQQQQQQAPPPIPSKQGSSLARGAVPMNSTLIQTNKTVDPFDSIGSQQFGGKRR